MHSVLAHLTVSVAEPNGHYAGLLRRAGGGPGAMSGHHRPDAGALAAAHGPQRRFRLEDLDGAAQAWGHAEGPCAGPTQQP